MNSEKGTKQGRRFISLLGLFLIALFIISFAGTMHFSSLSFNMSSSDAVAAPAMEMFSGTPVSFEKKM